MKKRWGNIGTSITEYALILGVVSIAFLSMNSYISRGIQGKVKDLTDCFVSDQQIGDINPTVISNSNSVVSSPSVRMDTTLYPGGISSLAYSDRTTTDVTADSVDQDIPVKDGVYIPVEAGTSVKPEIEDK